MSSSHTLCFLLSVKRQKHDFHFFFVQCIIKQLLHEVFVISRIIKVSVRVISRSPLQCTCTVPLKSKLPPLVSFLAIRVSFLSRRFSFLASCVSFLSRITEAFSMGYITRKKPVTCNNCCAVHCQIDGTFQHKICIDRLLDSYRTRVKSNIERNYK